MKRGMFLVDAGERGAETQKKTFFRIAHGSKAPIDGTRSLPYVSTTFVEYAKALYPSRSYLEYDKCRSLLFFCRTAAESVFCVWFCMVLHNNVTMNSRFTFGIEPNTTFGIIELLRPFPEV